MQTDNTSEIKLNLEIMGSSSFDKSIINLSVSLTGRSYSVHKYLGIHNK